MDEREKDRFREGVFLYVNRHLDPYAAGVRLLDAL